MSDMEIRKPDPSIFQRTKEFFKKEVDGDKKEEAGTWSNSTLDYVTKGGVTGGLLGAGMGAVAYAAGGEKTMTYKYEVPVMEKREIGQIPQNHVAADKVMGDPRFVKPDGKPVNGMGVKVEGEVPKRGILGGIQMEEKTGQATMHGHSLMASVIGGAIIGTIAGVISGVALKIINDMIRPKHSEQPWSRSAPPPWNNSGAGLTPWSRSSPEWKNSGPGEWSNSSPAWGNSAPQPWNNSGTQQPWSKSAPAWDNSHNKAPYNDVHYRSHSNYSDVHHRSHSNYSDVHHRSHSNYSNIHSNYSDVHHRSHSNYSNIHSNYSDVHHRSHSNYSNTHSNYSNTHKNAWDRHISY